jgi:putative aldouronate transport system permease protein
MPNIQIGKRGTRGSIQETDIGRGKAGIWKTIVKDMKRNKYVYLILLPVVAYYLIFEYGPMYGLQIAFKDFSPAMGIWGSPWIGFDHIVEFFNGFYFWRLVRNTFLLSFYNLAFGFPAAIILAMLLNEVRNAYFKRTVQSITYLPHFISLVVVVGMMFDFLARDGLVNQIMASFGIESIRFMGDPAWFRIIFVGSNIWQEVGWSSIIFLAAMATIDPSLYEAAKVDGAGRWRQAISVTLPGIMPTIIILLILRMGAMMSVGHEKIILMYNPINYETADVISTYVYRKGILEADYSFGTAVSFFNAIINFSLLLAANYFSRRYSETKLW